MGRRTRSNVEIIYEDEIEEVEALQEQETQEENPAIALENALNAVEDIIEGTQIFQSYQPEQIEVPEESIIDIEAETAPEVETESDAEPIAQEITLLDYFPNTPEEYDRGYRRLSPKERKVWGVPSEEEYDTVPGLAHSLGNSRNTVESWIYQCLEKYPSGFLKTRMGLTAECYVVLQTYRNYCGGDNYTKARKTRFLKKLDEQFEQYQAHMQAHRDKQLEAHQEEKSSALTHSPSVCDAEFVDEQTQVQIQVSFARSDRRRDAAIEDYAMSKTAQTIASIYRKVSQAKPVLDQAIQNGLTGEDLPDLSQIFTKE